MSRESRLRLIGLHAVLIASTIQGLTPDAQTIVSPWALEWFQACQTAGGLDACPGRMPGNDWPLPSGADGHDGTSAEVVLPGEPLAQTVLRQHLTVSLSHPFAPIGLCTPADASVSHRTECPRRLSERAGDLISILCRLTC